MNRLPKLKLLVAAFFVAFISLYLAPPIQAQILENIINAVKDLVFPNDENEAKGNVDLKSNISLVPNGDSNGNGIIDAGEIVRFEYIISNNTDEELKFAKLDTDIKRDSINYIHNVSGTTGLDDNGKSISIKNIRIPKNMEIKISFEARTNLYSDSDGQLTTMPEFSSGDNKYRVKLEKISKEIKKISKEDFVHNNSAKSITGGSLGKEIDEIE